MKLIDYCKENVKDLSVDFVHRYVNTELFTDLHFPHLQGLRIPILRPTVHTWMQKLGIYSRHSYRPVME